MYLFLEKKISKNEESFYRKYAQADAFIVLSSGFKIKLQNWGFKQPVYLTTTKVDDQLISDFDSREKIENYFFFLF